MRISDWSSDVCSSDLAYLFNQALGLLPTVLALVVGTDGFGWVLLAASGVLNSLITMPVVAGATVLVYLDLRERTEGLHLALRAQAQFATEPDGVGRCWGCTRSRRTRVGRTP